MPNPSVFIVDADARGSRVLDVSLKKAGFNVSVYESGALALAALADSVPDAIISEVLIGEIDGFELRRRMVANPAWSRVPFMFLTHEGSIESKLAGLELGVDEYLIKPVYIKEIVARLQILLQRRVRSRIVENDERTRFVGRLAEMSLVDLLQTLEIGKKSGVIQLSSARNRQAAIYFREGKLIDAEAGALHGADAVYRLVTWTDGSFEVVFRTVRRRDVITEPTQALLLEGVRRFDEWNALLEQMPPMQTCFEVDAHQLAQRLENVRDEYNPLLKLLDAKRSMVDIIERSALGDLETLQLISRFWHEKVLVETTVAEEPARPEHSGAWRLSKQAFEETPHTETRKARRTLPPEFNKVAPHETPGAEDSSPGLDPPAAPVAVPAAAPVVASAAATAPPKGSVTNDRLPAYVPDRREDSMVGKVALTKAPFVQTDAGLAQVGPAASSGQTALNPDFIKEVPGPSNHRDFTNRRDRQATKQVQLPAVTPAPSRVPEQLTPPARMVMEQVTPVPSAAPESAVTRGSVSEQLTPSAAHVEASIQDEIRTGRTDVRSIPTPRPMNVGAIMGSRPGETIPPMMMNAPKVTRLSGMKLIDEALLAIDLVDSASHRATPVIVLPIAAMAAVNEPATVSSASYRTSVDPVPFEPSVEDAQPADSAAAFAREESNPAVVETAEAGGLSEQVVSETQEPAEISEQVVSETQEPAEISEQVASETQESAWQPEQFEGSLAPAPEQAVDASDVLESAPIIEAPVPEPSVRIRVPTIPPSLPSAEQVASSTVVVTTAPAASEGSSLLARLRSDSIPPRPITQGDGVPQLVPDSKPPATLPAQATVGRDATDGRATVTIRPRGTASQPAMVPPLVGRDSVESRSASDVLESRRRGAPLTTIGPSLRRRSPWAPIIGIIVAAVAGVAIIHKCTSATPPERPGQPVAPPVIVPTPPRAPPSAMATLGHVPPPVPIDGTGEKALTPAVAPPAEGTSPTPAVAPPSKAQPPAAPLTADARTSPPTSTKAPAAASTDAKQNPQQLLEQSTRALRGGSFDKALTLVNEALQVKRSTAALLLRAEIYYRKGNHEAALDGLDDVLTVHTGNQRAWFLRGQILWKARRYQEGRAAFEEYLQLAPTGAEADYVRGLLAK